MDNMLTNNGTMDAIAMNNGQLYIKGTYIDVDDLSTINATIGGWKINKDNLSSATGDIKLTKDGKIKIGNATISASGKGAAIKYGISIYTTRYSGAATSDDGEFKLYGLASTSGYVLNVTTSNIVGKQASSSRRYKNHIRDMSQEEAEKLLSLPVVWFQYKKGYLIDGDPLCGKSIPGFYAEDVSKIFPECAVYDQKERPEDWNYRMMIPAMMKLIQDIYKEVRGT